MMIQAGGYRLRDLTDQEYDEADELARQFKRSLDYCPTCRCRYPVQIGEEDKPRQYFYDGEFKDCNCQEQIALFARYLLAGIPEQYMRLDWADYQGTQEAKLFVARYLSKWKLYRENGFGIEFGGPKLGIGKTFAATHIGKELIKRRQRVYFLQFVEMVAAFERSDAEAIEDRIRMTPYVILDEISKPTSQRQADFYHTRFEAMIRHRTNYNLPTIITTNLTAEELDKYYPRTYNLLAASQKRIDMDGENFRGIMGLYKMELTENGETRPVT